MAKYLNNFNSGEIMVNLSKEALNNKNNLLNQFLVIIVGNKEYEFKIDNITNKEIFIQKKFYFEEITAEDSKDSFEFHIQNLITDSGDFIYNSSELKQRSIYDKDKLMRKMFVIPIGDKKHGFRIISITSRYIKIENVLTFDLIERIFSKGIISLEYILHEYILGNDVDYSLFKQELSTDSIEDLISNDGSEETSDVLIDVGDINKLSDDEIDSKLINLKGWQKLVFDSIDNYDEDVFTIEILEKEEIYDKFRFEGESLTPTIERNLIPLVDIGLVKKFDEKHYVKLW